MSLSDIVIARALLFFVRHLRRTPVSTIDYSVKTTPTAKVLPGTARFIPPPGSKLKFAVQPRNDEKAT